MPDVLGLSVSRASVYSVLPDGVSSLVTILSKMKSIYRNNNLKKNNSLVVLALWSLSFNSLNATQNWEYKLGVRSSEISAYLVHLSFSSALSLNCHKMKNW